jgi:cytochrome c oxidase subunit III
VATDHRLSADGAAANHGLLDHQFDSLQQQHEAQLAGMWVFLATEILVFGVLFTAYIVFRYQHPAAFEEASRHLDLLIGGINTIVLLTSSLTMALAVFATRAGRRNLAITCLVLTAVLGTAFMVFKAIEYYIDYREFLVPGLAFKPAEWAQPEQVRLFFSCYYIMTGLHAVHLTIGIGLILVIAGRSWAGSINAANYMAVELSGLYWHFVDIVWIFLLPLLYLAGVRPGW